MSGVFALLLMCLCFIAIGTIIYKAADFIASKVFRFVRKASGYKR